MAEVKVGQTWTDPSDGHKREWRVVKVDGNRVTMDGTKPGSSVTTSQFTRIEGMNEWVLVRQSSSHGG